MGRLPMRIRMIDPTVTVVIPLVRHRTVVCGSVNAGAGTEAHKYSRC